MRDLDDARLYEVAGDRPNPVGHRTGRERATVRHLGLRLADAHGLDQHAVEQGASAPWRPRSGRRARPAGRAPPSSARRRRRRLPPQGVVDDATRSPSSAPPLAFEEGSTAITPTRLPRGARAATRAAQGRFADARRPVRLTTWALRRAPCRVEQRKVGFAFGGAFPGRHRRRDRGFVAGAGGAWGVISSRADRPRRPAPRPAARSARGRASRRHSRGRPCGRRTPRPDRRHARRRCRA